MKAKNKIYQDFESFIELALKELGKTRIKNNTFLLSALGGILGAGAAASILNGLSDDDFDLGDLAKIGAAAIGGAVLSPLAFGAVGIAAAAWFFSDGENTANKKQLADEKSRKQMEEFIQELKDDYSEIISYMDEDPEYVKEEIDLLFDQTIDDLKEIFR